MPGQIAFAERLKKTIAERGRKLDAVADHVGVARSTVSKWQTGSNEPGLESLVALANYLDVSADYLLGLSDEPRRQPAAVHPTGEGESTVRQFRRKDDRVGRMTAKELARVLAASGVKLDERTTLEELIRIVVRVMRAEQAG